MADAPEDTNMFSFSIIAVVVPVTLSCFLLSLLFLIREMPQLAHKLLRAGLGCSVYIVLAGVVMLTGWDDPLKATNAVSAEQHAALGDKMTGALMLDSHVWGVLLLVGGAYMIYLFTELMKLARQKQKK